MNTERHVNSLPATILSGLDDDEREYISGTNIAQWFITNAGRYDNIRILKTKLENAVFDKLTEKFILQREETSHDRGEVEIAE